METKTPAIIMANHEKSCMIFMLDLYQSANSERYLRKGGISIGTFG